MPMTPTIRPATSRDAGGGPSPDAIACAEIYAPYVTDTAASFESEPPSPDEMARRIERAHRWLVAVDPDEGGVLGYAYASPHRERAAYAWSADVSVYLAPHARGRGLGRSLYEHLLGDLTAAGYRSACAGIALPNPASEALHRGLGFETIGTYRRIGWKFHSWHDVLWLQLGLGDDGPPLSTPSPA